MTVSSYEADARTYATTGIRKSLEDNVRKIADLPRIACDEFYIPSMFHEDLYTEASVRFK